MTQRLSKFSRARELVSFLVLQRLKGFDVPTEPHFDPDFEAAFREKLAQSHQYLEFGTGGSSLLADRLGVSTIAIDNDRFFAAAVRKRLSVATKVRIHVADVGLTGRWGVPIPGTPTATRVRRWRRYVELPFGLLPAWPDLILIDGRFRKACALRVALQAGIEKRPTTIMFDDYFLEGRDNYHQLESLLGSPKRIGRGAKFSLSGTEKITEEHVTDAIRDYR